MAFYEFYSSIPIKVKSCSGYYGNVKWMWIPNYQCIDDVDRY